MHQSIGAFIKKYSALKFAILSDVIKKGVKVASVFNYLRSAHSADFKTLHRQFRRDDSFMLLYSAHSGMTFLEEHRSVHETREQRLYFHAAAKKLEKRS